MKKILTLLFLLHDLLAFGQLSMQSAKSAGMGGITAALTDEQSLFGNQAGLAWLENIMATATVERRFMLADLNMVGAGIAVPTKSGTFGLSVNSFGFEGFRRQKVGAAYARQLGKVFSIGAQFDYLQTRIPEYGSQGLITFEAGVQAKLGKSIVMGVHVFSPMPVEVVENEELPSILKMGLLYEISKKVALAAELEKDLDFPLRSRVGLDYRPDERVSIRGGFGTGPEFASFGLGFQINKNLRVDVAGSFLQTLGFSPVAGVVYQAGKKH